MGASDSHLDLGSLTFKPVLKLQDVLEFLRYNDNKNNERDDKNLSKLKRHE